MLIRVQITLDRHNIDYFVGKHYKYTRFGQIRVVLESEI